MLNCNDIKKLYSSRFVLRKPSEYSESEMQTLVSTYVKHNSYSMTAKVLGIPDSNVVKSIELHRKRKKRAQFGLN